MVFYEYVVVCCNVTLLPVHYTDLSNYVSILILVKLGFFYYIFDWNTGKS